MWLFFDRSNNMNDDSDIGSDDSKMITMITIMETSIMVMVKVIMI